MGLTDTKITLDNSSNEYYAGQTLNGEVLYAFDSPKTIRGIIIRFYGAANTEWTETKTVKDNDGKEHTETVTLTGHEEYFRLQYYLIGGPDSEITLNAGQHKYPFSCTLPSGLPSSFEGNYGHIRYTIKLTLDRPWKFDQKSEMKFTVITPVDLNENDRIKGPYVLELEKSFCCLCCRSGPLCATIKLPFTGFVSGQVIPVSVEVDNLSNVEVDDLVMVLCKTVKFYTTHPHHDTKINEENVTLLQFGPVESHASQTWQKTFEIPSIRPCNLINSSLIHLNYQLKIILKVENFHCNLGGVIPIIVGTIPLADIQPTVPYPDAHGTSLQHQQDLSVIRTQPMNNPTSHPTGELKRIDNALGWNIPETPPPQYSECHPEDNMGGKVMQQSK